MRVDSEVMPVRAKSSVLVGPRLAWRLAGEASYNRQPR